MNQVTATKRKRSKIVYMSIFFINILILIFSIGENKSIINGYSPVSSTSAGYLIDTSSKLSAKYSIFQIFYGSTVLNSRNSNNSVNKDAYHLYYFFQELENLSAGASSATIQNLLTACKIVYVARTYAYNTSTLHYLSITMEKHYDYGHATEDTTKTYILNESAFNKAYENVYFSFIVRTETSGLINLPNSGVVNLFFEDHDSEQLSLEDYNLKYLYTPVDTISPSLDINSGLQLSLPGGTWNEVTNVYIYHNFRRYFVNDQTLYNYSSGYFPISPVIHFQGTPSVSGKDLDFRLIDNDKIILTFTDDGLFDCELINRVTITMEQHYKRNVYNYTNVTTISQAENQGFSELIGNYFHRLGNTDGDYSNVDNVKYVKSNHLYSSTYPSSSVEVIFNQNSQVVTNPLILGTFNFVDAGVSINKHSAVDVLPYIIWGNNSQDPSKVKERIAWDYNSRNIALAAIGFINHSFDGMWYSKRGSNLYTLYQNDTSNILNLTNPAIFSTQNLLDLASRLNNYE